MKFTKAIKLEDLARQYAEKHGTTIKDSRTLILNVMNTVSDNLKEEGDKVTISHLFSMEVVKRKERSRFNVNTGTMYTMKPYNTLKITTSKKFRVKLNSTL